MKKNIYSTYPRRMTSSGLAAVFSRFPAFSPNSATWWLKVKKKLTQKANSEDVSWKRRLGWSPKTGYLWASYWELAPKSLLGSDMRNLGSFFLCFRKKYPKDSQKREMNWRWLFALCGEKRKSNIKKFEKSFRAEGVSARFITNLCHLTLNPQGEAFCYVVKQMTLCKMLPTVQPQRAKSIKIRMSPEVKNSQDVTLCLFHSFNRKAIPAEASWNRANYILSPKFSKSLIKNALGMKQNACKLPWTWTLPCNAPCSAFQAKLRERKTRSQKISKIQKKPWSITTNIQKTPQKHTKTPQNSCCSQQKPSKNPTHARNKWYAGSSRHLCKSARWTWTESLQVALVLMRRPAYSFTCLKGLSTYQGWACRLWFSQTCVHSVCSLTSRNFLKIGP